MNITRTGLLLIGVLAAAPLLSSCATRTRSAAAGAATYAAYDKRQDEQKKENYAKHKKEQRENR